MGFLSGVLSNIQGHLGQHKTKISEAIRLLEHNKHAGKKGFNDAIGSVVAGVRGYNGRVEQSNNHVKSKIEGFDRNMKRLKKTVSEMVENNPVADEALKYQQAAEEIERRLAEYEKRAADFNKTLDMQRNDETTRNAINDLNDKLRDRIDNVRKTMVHEKSRLTDLAAKEKERFRSMEACIKATLEGVGTCVNREIGNKVKELIRGLRQMVETMFEQLEKINKGLPQHVDKLQEWINDADKEIDVTQGYLKKITEQTDNSLTSLKYPIEDAVTELRKRRDELSTYIENTVKGGLTGLVETIERHFKDVKLNVQGDGTRGSKQGLVKDWDALSDELQTLGSGVTNTIKNGHLDKIVNGIEEYASGFNADEFGKKVEQWVSDALKNNGAVKYCMKRYISENKERLNNRFPFNTEYITTERDELNHKNIPQIATTIKSKLRGLINSAGAKSDGVIKSMNLKKQLEYVQEVCVTFARAIAQKFNDPANAVLTFAEEISRDIESVFCTEGRPPSYTGYSDSHLKSAIRALLTALQSTVQRINDELQTFAVSLCDLGINVKGTVDKIKQIKQNISIDDNHSTSRARQITHSLSAVTGRVKDLDPILKEDGGFLKSQINDITVAITTKAITDMSAKITDTLKLLTRTISDAAFFANQKLENLKHIKIGKSPNKGELQKLQHSFNDLKEPVTVALKTAKSFLGSVDHSGTATIQALGKDVDSQVESAKRALITKAREQYVTSVQGLLVAFSTKAEQELEPLPKEITDDLDIGYKGFMNKFEKSFITGDKSIVVIKDIETASPQKESPLRQAAGKFHLAVRRFFRELEAQPDFKSDFAKTKPSYDALTKLLTALAKSEHFDHTFRDNLNAFRNVVTAFTRSTYGEANCPLLLNALKKGLTALVSELDKAYISAYDSETIQWTETALSTGLTQDAHRCAKIFLTAFSTIYDAVHDLRINCHSLKGHQIHSSSDLGRLFLRHGFKVSDGAKQHWELQNKSVINGEYVANRLSFRVDGAKDNKHLKECESNKRQTKAFFNLFDILECILHHVDQYNALCHIALLPKPRTPCTVFEMLVWLSGLTYTSAYQALLSDGFTNVLDNPDTPLAGDEDISVFDIEKSYLEAHPQTITYKSIRTGLQYLCSKSYDLLTTVVGHGDAATFYACDYSNNTLNLYYPSSGEDCLQMLLDFLRRILQPLRYLFERCSVADKNYGWADCHYGRDVPTTKSHCNNKPTDEATCLPNCQPDCKPNCQPTSPLMNYLSDSLLGYLPHRLESVGCKSKCSTCPSTSRLGMPCVTPLGFRAFSGSTKTGRALCEMIRELIGGDLISSLLSLVPRPPSTLPEHFGFALSLVGGWKHGTEHQFRTVIESSIRSVSIDLVSNTADLTSTLTNAYGSKAALHENCEHSHLITLSSSAVCYGKSKRIDCAPYISTLCNDFYHYLPHKHAGIYLSWALYLPWSFHEYLRNLYNEFCNIFCQDWGCQSCLQGDKCRRGKHGQDRSSCGCSSLASCKGVSPALYRYGFRLGDAAKLHSSSPKKMCYNFQKQLSRVINSTYFTTLFEKCDEFLFTIRAPFIWLNVALWSLSLFYLIIVMVGRLDVLHIRSHLRIPSSHKITAQSLLAAAQVGRLAKISYLQP